MEILSVRELTEVERAGSEFLILLGTENMPRYRADCLRELEDLRAVLFQDSVGDYLAVMLTKEQREEYGIPDEYMSEIDLDNIVMKNFYNGVEEGYQWLLLPAEQTREL